MKQIRAFIVILSCGLCCGSQNEIKVNTKAVLVPVNCQDSQDCYNDGGYTYPKPQSSLSPPIYNIIDTNNPLLAALLLSTSLGINPKIPGFNHPEHLPLNPYLALLLSHYGRYAPIHGTGRGIYGYTAANNYHNNKPFGAYKIYEDNDS